MHTWNVIHETFFIEWSLREIRKKLICEDSHDFRALIVNYVIRYFVWFVFPNSVDKSLSLWEINAIYSQVLWVLSISRKERLNLVNEVDGNIFNCCNKSEYATTMLCDISHTSALVEDIICRDLKLPKWEVYYGLDLWTWSWQLLDAQDICRQRNWLEEWVNIWIDICDDHTERATALISQLSASEIRIGDLTQASIYESLPNQKVSQVTAELIGQPWVSVLLDEDPFHMTMLQLFWFFKNNLQDTQFFPEEFHMTVRHVWVELERIIWMWSNKFNWEEVFDIKDWNHQTGIGKALLAYKGNDLVAECTGIKINWEVLPLEDIWKNYEWIVTLDLECMPRRWVNQRRELISYLNSQNVEMKMWIISLILTKILKNNIDFSLYLSNDSLIDLLNTFKNSSNPESFNIKLSKVIVNNSEYILDFISFIKNIPLHLLK